MEKFNIGDFVTLEYINEVGLVGDVQEGYLRCWWHRGGTRAIIRTEDAEKLSLEEVKSRTFRNDHVKTSLLERRRRLLAGEDVSDLIDVR